MRPNSHENPFPNEEINPLVQAIHQLDVTEEVFFEAAASWVRTPSPKKLDVFNTSLEANGNAFYDVVSEITTSEESEPEEKSLQIATLFIDSDKNRVEHFRKIAPKGQFARMPETRGTISKTILTKFEVHDDLDTICFEIVNNYANHLNSDTKRLQESIQSGKRLKSMEYLEKAKENTSHIGKISLGVAIGSIVASRVIKKLDQ
jgi:hypothetical protein